VADLNTNINIVVNNLKKVKDLGKTFKDAATDAERIENKIKAINAALNRAKQKFNTVDPDQPRDKKGRFTKDPDRNRRRNAYAEMRMQKARQATEKRIVQRELEVIQRKQRLIQAEKAGALKRAQIEERILQKRLKLSAAKGLVSRKLREAGSAGLTPTSFGIGDVGGEGKKATARRTELNEQVGILKQGFNDLQAAGNENIQTYRALGSELSRTVEELNALNKATARRSVGFQKGRRLQERLDVIDPGKGAKAFTKPSDIAKARKASSNVIAAAQTGDQNLYNAALSKATAAVSRLEREYKEGEKALKEERRLRKIGAKARRRAASKRADIQGRFKESLMLGAGFPLLFGGGVGAVAGGVGGAIAGKGGKGFGAQILFSALGQQFDALVSSMVSSTQKLGNALGQYTQDTGQLVQSLGLAGTAEGQRIKIIEELQGANAAFTAAMQQLTNAVGQKGVADLKKFGDNVRLVGSEMRIFFTKVQAGLAGILNLADKILRLSQGAKESRIERFVETTDNAEIVALRKRRDEILEGTGGGRSGAKRRGESVAKIEEQMAGLGAPALAQQDAAVAVDTIMMRQKEMTKSLEEEFVIHSKILELKKNKGLTDEVAKAVAQEAVVMDRTKVALQEKLDELEKKQVDSKGETVALSLEDLELQKAIKDALNGQGEALENLIKKRTTLNTKTKENKVTIEDIKEKLATGLQSAIEGLIDGTKTLGESLAGIAKSIGSMFLQAGIRNMFGLAEGGYATGGIKAFSSGGLVTRPTIGLVGEAGEDEYIIPSSKMQGAMERYSAGARGQGVIPGSGTVTSGSGVPGGSVQIDYTGPILNFNSEEFVPRSAIPAIVNSAARKGASAGSAQVFSQMRNSRSTRSRMAL